MKSKVISLYKDFLQAATQKHIEFVDSVYHLGEKNYQNGGDILVETFTPQEILQQFKDLKDVYEYVGLKLEQGLNTRWGEDSDPQLVRYEGYTSSWED